MNSNRLFKQTHEGNVSGGCALILYTSTHYPVRQKRSIGLPQETIYPPISVFRYHEATLHCRVYRENADLGVSLPALIIHVEIHRNRQEESEQPQDDNYMR